MPKGTLFLHTGCDGDLGGGGVLPLNSDFLQLNEAPELILIPRLGGLVWAPPGEPRFQGPIQGRTSPCPRTTLLACPSPARAGSRRETLPGLDQVAESCMLRASEAGREGGRRTLSSAPGGSLGRHRGRERQSEGSPSALPPASTTWPGPKMLPGLRTGDGGAVDAAC